MKGLVHIFIIFVLLTSCSKDEEEFKTIWVYPYKLNDSLAFGGQKGNQYYISYLENFNDNFFDWSVWSLKDEDFNIEGFNFEEGFFYKLLILPGKDENEVILKSILDKKKDQIEKIKGGWVTLPEDSIIYKKIYLDISPVNRFLNGSSGCFTFKGHLGYVDDQKFTIKSFWSTLEKLCWGLLSDTEKYTPPNLFRVIISFEKYSLNQEGILEFYDPKEDLKIRFQPLEK